MSWNKWLIDKGRISFVDHPFYNFRLNKWATSNKEILNKWQDLRAVLYLAGPMDRTNCAMYRSLESSNGIPLLKLSRICYMSLSVLVQCDGLHEIPKGTFVWREMEEFSITLLHPHLQKFKDLVSRSRLATNETPNFTLSFVSASSQARMWTFDHPFWMQGFHTGLPQWPTSAVVTKRALKDLHPLE